MLGRQSDILSRSLGIRVTKSKGLRRSLNHNFQKLGAIWIRSLSKTDEVRAIFSASACHMSVCRIARETSRISIAAGPSIAPSPSWIDSLVLAAGGARAEINA